MTKLPSWPNYSEEEAELAKSVLLSNKVNYWTGQEARSFESEYSLYFESEFSIALANGTVAIDLALMALEIGAGDEVVVTPRSFIASASAVVNCGARPVFADVDLTTQNIDAESIAAVITKKTKAIVCVHLAGWPCDMPAIVSLAEQHGIAIIEDCAQAHGSKIDGVSVGTFGDVGAWSFCQDKIMTTAGEGGMVTTNNESLHRVMWSYKDHGKSWDKVHTPATSTAFRWIHDSVGTNWRMTEIQAAIGRFQLTRLPEWVGERQRNAATLNRCLANVDGIRLTQPPQNLSHAYYKYYFFIEPELLSAGWSRDRVLFEVHAEGVPCFTGACPEIYREKALTDLYGEQARLANAAALGESSLLLNVHPGLTDQHAEHAAEVVGRVMSKAVR